MLTPGTFHQDRLNESTERTTTEAGNLSAKAPPSSLETLSRLPPELRIPIYKYVARNCSIAPNKPKQLEKIIGNEFFPQFLSTSKQLFGEFTEFHKKLASPIVLLERADEGLDQRLSAAIDSSCLNMRKDHNPYRRCCIR